MGKYYNSSTDDEYYVIAKERIEGGVIVLNYVSEINYYKNKYCVAWCQDLDLAYRINFKHLSKRETKLALEKWIKRFGLYGKVNGFKVKCSDVVQYKVT